ncbi:Nn.00g058780.m01.CDS01 [Neocucurbitaria sp. VM-36]
MEGQRETAKGRQRSQQTVPIQQDFLFVDAAQAKTSRQGRRNARSFVMQKARRERPWSTSKHAAKQRKTVSPDSTSPNSAGTPDSLLTPNTTTPSPPIVTSSTDYFPSVVQNPYSLVNGDICPDCQVLLCRPGQKLCPRCLLLKPAAPADDPNNRLFDPFRTSSVEINGSVSELLEHFVTDMAPGIIAVDIRHRSTLMRSDWFGTAISNPGFMHSLLCTAALHLYIVGRGSIETILHHRAQAIASINAAISSSDSAMGISDANIGAVFNLLTVEEGLLLPFFEQEKLNEDQPNQRAIHLSGLRRMVQLRGGLNAISSNRILQAFILWHSTAHAIASFEAPNHSTLDYISSASFPRHPPGYCPNISQHLIDYSRHAGVKESLTDLVESVLILIADLNVWFSDPNSPLDPLDMQNFSCVLECMLLKWLRENEYLITPLEDALCVALLIFTVRTTEAMKRRSDIHLLHFAASKRLEKALNCTVRSEWQYCPDLLLWILSIAAISAEGSAESCWFVYQASIACAEFSILSAQALLERLHICGWVSYKLDEAVCHLWDRIVTLRLEPYFEAPSKAEDADSPVGPLQHHVAEPDFVEWESIDWAMLSLGPDFPIEFQTPRIGNF